MAAETPRSVTEHTHHNMAYRRNSLRYYRTQSTKNFLLVRKQECQETFLQVHCSLKSPQTFRKFIEEITCSKIKWDKLSLFTTSAKKLFSYHKFPGAKCKKNCPTFKVSPSLNHPIRHWNHKLCNGGDVGSKQPLLGNNKTIVWERITSYSDLPVLAEALKWEIISRVGNSNAEF
jgi:hypothetical protein